MGNTFSHFASCFGELSTSPQPGFFELSQRLWALWATRSVVSSSRAERLARTWFKLESEAVDGTELNRSELHRGVTVIVFMQADHSPTSGRAMKISSPCHLISPLLRTRRSSQSLA